MRLKYVNQIQYSEFNKNTSYDVLLVASGYETRARFLAETTRVSFTKKYAISFNTHNNIESKSINDSYFNSFDFKILEGDGDNTEAVSAFFSMILEEFQEKTEINVVVDYSSMSRVWYASLLDLFRNSQSFNGVNIFFCYTRGKFIDPPKEEKYNQIVEPINGFCSLSIPDRPTALLIGLGYEKNRAFGLTEYFDAETFLFYTDSINANKYCSHVEQKNESIIKKTKIENIFKYRIEDLNYTFSLLMNLGNDLNKDFRVILAPCGPKIFTLICLLVSLKNPEIDVWRISPGKSGTPVNYEPEYDPLVLKVSFLID